MNPGTVQDPLANEPHPEPPNEASAELSPPIDSPVQMPRRFGPAWNDVPLRNKVILLIVLAALGGALIGILEARSGNPGWVLSLGLTLLMAALLVLAKAWIGAPIQVLVEHLGRINREYSISAINALPIQRRDEVGQIARSIHQITSWCRRDYHEAKQLRRTLDHRVATATRAATRELRRLVMRDPLTDMGNRRFLSDHLDTLIDSVRQSGGELVAVVIDVDNFKQVNDTHGHGAGDDLLVFLAGLIRANVRGEDYAVRLGGDEFVVLMPGCTVERAVEIANRILSLFRQQMQARFRGEKESTLSIGITSLQRDSAKTGKELLERADEKLYAAKRAGKNQVAGA